jgi:hypothetical protein
MKRLLIPLAVAAGCALLLERSAHLSAQKKQAAVSAHRLPAFAFPQPEGPAFTWQRLQPNLPLMLVYFSPDCGSCWKQLHYATDSALAGKSLQLLVLADATPSVAKAISEWLGRHAQHPYQVALASPGDFERQFGTRASPSVFCYDRHGRLASRFHGETHPAALLPHFPNALP